MEHSNLSSCNLPKQINFIGPSCQEFSITLDTLISPTTTTRNDSVSVTLPYLDNGSILELDQVRLKQNLTLPTVSWYSQSLIPWDLRILA